MQISNFGDYDALLAIATDERSYAFQVPSDVASQSEASALQRNEIEPATAAGRLGGCRRRRGRRAERTGDLDGPSSGNSGVTWLGFLIAMAVLGLLILALYFWSRRRRRKRREAEFAAAKRVDPADPNALAAVPIDALDDLSKMMVVDVDNAIRTSDSELALAVEEFGSAQTETFSRAVGNAKTTLAQAFNVRQILDDAVPETPHQRRDLLTRVVVAAAKADRELDAQSEAFDKLRDLVINAPTRLDAMTQQMVDLTARLGPSEQALAALHSQFDAAALTSVADNVRTAKQRLGFADQNISNARTLVARPVGQQMGLVDAIRAAESSLGTGAFATGCRRQRGRRHQSRRRGTSRSPSPTSRTASTRPAGHCSRATPPMAASSRRHAIRQRRAVADAQKNGSTDPLGTFTRSDQGRRRTGSAAGHRDRGTPSGQTPRQGVRPGIVFRAVPRAGRLGLHRHSPRQHWTRGPHQARRSRAATSGCPGQEGERNLSEAIAHANGADMLAGAGAIIGQQ